jgi:hypothetical protein
MSTSHTIPLMFCSILSMTINVSLHSAQNPISPGDQSYTPSLQEVLASPQPVDYITKPEVSADVQTQAQSLQSSRWHKFPSGVGAIAVGHATYSIYENPTATRISKRLAYLDAYTNAKTNLAQMLLGAFIQTEQNQYSALALGVTGTEDVGNLVRTYREKYKQVVRGTLRGFVIFDVEDDGKGNVSVSVISTPRTRSILSHTTENVVCAKTFSDGLAVLMNEIRRGVTPPVGGKIVTVPDTGDITLVGFGSAVVRRSGEPGLQSAMRTAAERTAQLRARTSLMLILKGESFVWTLDTDESMRQYIQQFSPIEDQKVLQQVAQIEQKSPLQRIAGAAADVSESVASAVTGKRKNEPKSDTVAPLSEAEIENALYTPPGPSIRVFDSTRRYMQADSSTKEAYKVIESGNLPPGVIPMTWTDEEGGTVYSVAVYNARSSELAKQAATEMREGRSFEQIGGTVGHDLDPSLGFKINETGSQPSSEVRKGPTGRVTDEKDG